MYSYIFICIHTYKPQGVGNKCNSYVGEESRQRDVPTPTRTSQTYCSRARLCRSRGANAAPENAGDI